MIVLEAVDLTKVYIGGDGGSITVLDGVNLQVSRGQMVAVVGASGTGKSTLLHLLGALDRPTRGSVQIAGQSTTGRDDDALSALINLGYQKNAAEKALLQARQDGVEPIVQKMLKAALQRLAK